MQEIQVLFITNSQSEIRHGAVQRFFGVLDFFTQLLLFGIVTRKTLLSPDYCHSNNSHQDAKEKHESSTHEKFHACEFISASWCAKRFKCFLFADPGMFCIFTVTK